MGAPLLERPVRRRLGCCATPRWSPATWRWSVSTSGSAASCTTPGCGATALMDRKDYGISLGDPTMPDN
jgi:hypothetical protein